MTLFNGVYVTRRGGGHRFVKTDAPTSGEMAALVKRIATRVGRHLERKGLLVRDAENAYLEWDGEAVSPLDDLACHAITYRLAVSNVCSAYPRAPSLDASHQFTLLISRSVSNVAGPSGLLRASTIPMSSVGSSTISKASICSRRRRNLAVLPSDCFPKT